MFLLMDTVKVSESLDDLIFIFVKLQFSPVISTVVCLVEHFRRYICNGCAVKKLQ